MFRAMIIKLIPLVLLSIVGCAGRDNKNAAPASLVPSIVPGTIHPTEKTQINLAKSIVKWKGTKLMGAGSHSGTVKFKSGHLLYSNGQLAGGQFEVDMTSIYNTDIPLSDPVPRKNITFHLNSDFETNQYPTSRFIITGVQKRDGVFTIEGTLIIKGIENKITFKAVKSSDNVYSAEFSFNRFDWEIGENGTWLEKKLVDPLIHLNVIIQT